MSKIYFSMLYFHYVSTSGQCWKLVVWTNHVSLLSHAGERKAAKECMTLTLDMFQKTHLHITKKCHCLCSRFLMLLFCSERVMYFQMNFFVKQNWSSGHPLPLELI